MSGIRQAIEDVRGQLAGSIFDSISQQTETPTAKDGINSYGNNRLFTSTNIGWGVSPDGADHRISLTNRSFDVIDFDESYIHVICRFHFQITGTATSGGTKINIGNDISVVSPTTETTIYPQYTGITGAPLEAMGASLLSYLPSYTTPTYKSIGTAVGSDLNTQASTSLDLSELKSIHELPIMFIGLKSSANFLRDYQIEFNNVPIASSKQDHALTESYMLHISKAKSQLKNKNHVHSTWKECNQWDNSMCGVFITLNDLLYGANHTPSINSNGVSWTADAAAVAGVKQYSDVVKNMEIIIPYREIYIFQGMTEYPNGIFGLLNLICRFTTTGLVHCPVDTKYALTKLINKNQHIGQEVNTLITNALMSQYVSSELYTHEFNQIGLSSTYAMLHIDSDTNTQLDYSRYSLLPTVSEAGIMSFYADVRGYRMSEECKKMLVDYFSEPSCPFVVPSQKVIPRQFRGDNSGKGQDNQLNCRFPYVTDVAILHPISSAYTTIYKNITATNYKLKIGNREFPHQNDLSTYGAEFYEMMLMNSDFNDIWECPESYEHSLTDPVVDTTTTYDGLNSKSTITSYFSSSDATDFVPIFKCQRDGGSQSTWFDGINSLYESVELTYNMVDDESSSINPYYQKKTAPYLVMNCQTYWIFRFVDGQANCQYLTDGDFRKGFENPKLNAAEL